MKLSLLFLVIFCFQVSAETDAQTITISVKNGKMENVLKDIRRQSGFDFVYTLDVLKKAKQVTLKFDKADIKDVLNECFRDQPLTYSIISNVVVIKELPTSITSTTKPIAEIANIDVQGKVVNESGTPVLASVIVKGSSNGTSTNDKGEFSLTNVSENAILVFTGVTIESKEVKLGGKTFISVTVQTKVTSSEEVIISTGYSQMQKTKITGAVSSIGREKYDQRVAVTGNFAESLEGKIPGLVVNSQSGEITIRGISTFDAVKQPLIVVDGFPTEIDIRSINPNDIISVNVLKDAAAASIYGARASNGVIIIETKRGKSGAAVFNFRATQGFQDKPNFGYLKFGSALDYAGIQSDYTILSGQSGTTYANAKAPVSPVQQAVYDFKAGNISKPELDSRIQAIGGYDNLKEYSDLFYRRRLTSNIDLDVSGGTEKNTYLLGVNYIGDETQNQRNNNQSFLLNFASTHQFTKAIKFDFRAIYSNYKSTDAGNNSTVNDFNNKVSLNKFYPYEKLADENGNALPVNVGPNRNPYTGILSASNSENMVLGLYDQMYYPYQELFANTNTTKTTAVRFQGRLNAKLSKWLSLDLGGVFEDQPTSRDLLQTDEAFTVRRLLNYKATKDPVTGLASFPDLPQGDFLTRVNQKTSDYTVRGQFNINYHTPDFKHSISAIAGSEIRKTTLSSYMNSFFGYDGQSLIVRPVNFIKLASPFTTPFKNIPTLSRPNLIYEDYFGEAYDDRRFVSFYGDGTYVYDDRFSLSGSFRLDKTNLFGTDPKFRNKPFYSIGANWRISNESFAKDISWLSDLKLRAAYGENGNIPTSNNGPFLILNSGLNYDVFPFPQYYDVQSPQNQSLRWERTSNTNVGLDFAVFSNRVFGSLDYYKKNSKDVFGQYSSDPTSGFNEYNANTASILNNGFEISINSINIKEKNFAWQTQITGSFNKNEVTAVKTVSNSQTGLPLVSILNIQKGFPINALFAYEYAGLSNLGIPQIIGADGKPKVINSSASGTDEVALEDLKFMGTTTPKYVVGLNNQFTFGNFDLSFLFMYYGGYVTRVEAPDPFKIIDNGRVLAGSENYWKKAGDETSTEIPGFPVINTPGYFDSYARLGYNYASKFVRKADNIRLRDVVVTYNLKAAALSKMGFSRTQLRAQIQNAFNYTFSGNDIDPDAINRVTGQRTLKQQPFFSISFYTNF
ncbi:MAG: SusC/RagA family TonB-linked outer membrane protein [Ginsengibacter sp.]